jgi:murein DD-endopeptidase MepM/ murein hydrolase activator NlpD
MKKVFFILSIALVLTAGCNKAKPVASSSSATSTSSASSQTAVTTPPANSSKAAPGVVSPISDPESRITKIFFGTYVTPKNSPIMPERFTGYHTGLDFETTSAEQNTDVQINVICAGKLLKKGYASGYGGYAVQACTINKQSVTIVYGHLRESSIAQKVGQELSAGDHLAVLGTGYSTETDGERKHLHLGIHIGTSINILGYVPNKSQLSGWLDPKAVLGL